MALSLTSTGSISGSGDGCANKDVIDLGKQPYLIGVIVISSGQVAAQSSPSPPSLAARDTNKTDDKSAARRQTAVTACLKSKQLQLFVFVRRICI